MELMKDMGRQMKVLGRMDKGFINFDAGAVQVAVARIAVLAEKTPTLFEAPAQDPNSEALPVIWDDFSTFAQEAQALEMVTARLTIVQQIDLHPALKQLGAACKSCHGRFRK
ncbi:c-type cytochrome [Puniceibacterium sediminis]|nr:cytochrome c [Puniceibacterium sediminis]